MAAAALTTEKSLDDLRAINRKQYDLLEPLGASRASLLTLVVTPHQRTPAVDALLDVVDRMQALAATRCTCWGWTDGNG